MPVRLPFHPVRRLRPRPAVRPLPPRGVPALAVAIAAGALIATSAPVPAQETQETQAAAVEAEAHDSAAAAAAETQGARRGARVAGAPAPRYAPLVEGMAPVPFALGERLDYDVKFGPLRVGRGAMEIRDVTDVRGVPSWHAVFTIKGGVPFFRVDDRMETWFDIYALSSRRFHQRIREGGYKRDRRYEVFPERAAYRLGEEAEKPSVRDPLDDASFLYFVRTMPLVVGETYVVPRYFNPEGNPVRLTVVRRETVEVPAGTFDAFVVRPTFQTKGIFSEDGEAEVWISADDRRLIVQLKSKLSFGSLGLQLRGMSIPDPTIGADSAAVPPAASAAASGVAARDAR